MKCVRFEDLRTGNKRIGFIDGDVIRCVYGSLETYWQITDETFAMRDVRLLAPCVPKQIICVSFNYQKHAAEFGVEIPREPSIFSKAAHTVVGTGADIIWPKQVQELAFGAELGIVVKKRMKNVKQKMYLNIFWVIPVLMMLRPATCSARSASGCAVNPLIPSVPWDRGWKRSWIPAIYPSALMSTVCLSRMRARAI